MCFQFRQNEPALKYLLKTGNSQICFCHPTDSFLGIGIGKAEPESRNPDKWRGRNLLGQMLMKTRDSLRNDFKEKIDEWAKPRQVEQPAGKEELLSSPPKSSSSSSAAVEKKREKREAVSKKKKVLKKKRKQQKKKISSSSSSDSD